MWFNGNQLPPPMENSSETHLKKKNMSKTKTRESANNATSS